RGGPAHDRNFCRAREDASHDGGARSDAGVRYCRDAHVRTETGRREYRGHDDLQRWRLLSGRHPVSGGGGGQGDRRTVGRVEELSGEIVKEIWPQMNADERRLKI